MITMINRRFGTWRGLVRLLLGYAELASGRLQVFRIKEPEAVQRLVFVCLGNICRSAAAEKAAADLGMIAVSLGLSTTTGATSPSDAVKSGKRLGIDLNDHRAIDWNDFKVMPGDLFLAMEIRQAHELRLRLKERTDVAVSLLGLWCSPVIPHIHDPFTLSADYFDTCFVRVRQAVCRLSQSLPAARRPLVELKFAARKSS
jgi:protein-tyrosine phosphatase